MLGLEHTDCGIWLSGQRELLLHESLQRVTAEGLLRVTSLDVLEVIGGVLLTFSFSRIS